MRVIEDAGCAARVLKPLKLPVYDPGQRPDAVACAGCLIVVNDRSDGNPRLSVEVSNGASWDKLALNVSRETLAEHRPVDLMPMVVQAVRDQLPVLVKSSVPQPIVIEHKPNSVSDLPKSVSDGVQHGVRDLAQAVLDMNDYCQRLEHYCQNLEHRIDTLERRAIIDAQLERVA